MEFNEDRTELKIHASRLHDEGTYDCIAMNPAGNATQNLLLYVGGIQPLQSKSFIFEIVLKFLFLTVIFQFHRELRKNHDVSSLKVVKQPNYGVKLSEYLSHILHG